MRHLAVTTKQNSAKKGRDKMTKKPKKSPTCRSLRFSSLFMLRVSKPCVSCNERKRKRKRKKEIPEGECVAVKTRTQFEL